MSYQNLKEKVYKFWFSSLWFSEITELYAQCSYKRPGNFLTIHIMPLTKPQLGRAKYPIFRNR